MVAELAVNGAGWTPGAVDAEVWELWAATSTRGSAATHAADHVDRLVGVRVNHVIDAGLLRQPLAWYADRGGGFRGGANRYYI